MSASCPECGVLLESDHRFSDWCSACDWNVDPLAAVDPRRPPSARPARRRERQEALLRRVCAGATDPVRLRSWHVLRDPALIAALLLAGAVDLVTLASAAAGGWLLFGNGPCIVSGVVLLGITVALRPRLGKPPRHRLDRSAAPALYAVADRVAAATGAGPVAVIGVDAGYRLSVSRVGVRRRRVLTLGLALWETLTPQQRLAALAHEFAHDAGGDRRHGPVVQAAGQTLAGWERALLPTTGGDRFGDALTAVTSAGTIGRGRAQALGTANIGEALSRIVLGAAGGAVRQVRRALDRLTERSGHRAGYLADRAAARTASSRAMEGVLRALPLLPTAVVALERMTAGAPVARGRGGAGPAGLWPEFAAYMASVPSGERARRLRLAELRGEMSAPGHPPAHLRISHVRTLAYAEPSVLFTEADSSIVQAELQPASAALAAELMR